MGAYSYSLRAARGAVFRFFSGHHHFQIAIPCHGRPWKTCKLRGRGCKNNVFGYVRFFIVLGTILEVILALFLCFWEGSFQCNFCDAPFRHFGRFGRPQVSTREVWGGHFEAILGVGSTCENRCFILVLNTYSVLGPANG